MMTFLKAVLFFAIAVIINSSSVQCQDTMTVCGSSKFKEQCDQINRDSNVKCQEFRTNVDCMLNLENGTATFAMLKPDEAILGSKLLNKVTVVGEVRPLNDDEFDSEFQIVVLVKQKFNSFNDLKNKRYCHPGFGKLKGSLGYLTYFENTLINALKLVDCKDENTILPVKHLSALNEFFGESCRPGLWFPDVTKDAELKSNFTKLCNLCKGTSCSGDDILDPFLSAMGCFMDKGGDVVVTSYKAMKSRPDLTKPIYLCPDGKTREEVCYWSKRPWNLIVAYDSEGQNITEYLRSSFRDRLTGLQSDNRAVNVPKILSSVLFPMSTDKLYLLPNPRNLKDYLKDYTFTPTKPICDNKLRWCTTSELETNKCQWFNQAVLNEGINLEVQCVSSQDQLQCLENMKSNKVDIVTIDNDYSFAARRKHLIAVAFPETAERYLTKSMIVVKESENVTGFSDMRNSFICFSEFGNLAFISWLELLKDQSQVSRGCDYGDIVSNYVGDSCAPGVIDPWHEKTAATDTKKLCHCTGSVDSKTATNCNADSNNKYYKTGVLDCLNEMGQFAVMTNKDIPNSIEHIDHDLYRIICKNGSLAVNSGFDVDDNCYMSVSINTEVIVQNNTNFKNNLFYMELFEILFGQNLEKSFALFGVFNNTEDLMFKESTPGLDFRSSDNSYIENHLKTFETYDNCVERGDSGSILYKPYPLSLFAAVIIFMLV